MNNVVDGVYNRNIIPFSVIPISEGGHKLDREFWEELCFNPETRDLLIYD